MFSGEPGAVRHHLVFFSVFWGFKLQGPRTGTWVSSLHRGSLTDLGLKFTLKMGILKFTFSICKVSTPGALCKFREGIMWVI